MNNINIFKKYVANFDMEVKDINRKFFHSLRVSNLSKRIAISLDLEKDIVDLVEFIGLVHDIGRFRQWEKYHTYDDGKSIDHALNGIKVLFDDGVINDFNINKSYYEIIKKAIFYHNKLKIDEELTKLEMLICQIIRDADKVDLLFILSENMASMDEDNGLISENVATDFINKKSINKVYCMTGSDKVLFKMAFVFDLHYQTSFEIVWENDYLAKFFNNLKYQEKYKIYYELAQKFVNYRKFENK